MEFQPLQSEFPVNKTDCHIAVSGLQCLINHQYIPFLNTIIYHRISHDTAIESRGGMLHKLLVQVYRLGHIICGRRRKSRMYLRLSHLWMLTIFGLSDTSLHIIKFIHISTLQIQKHKIIVVLCF